MIEPFNGNIFELRYKYADIFSTPELAKDYVSPSQKIYKIKYSINLISQCGMFTEMLNPDGNKDNIKLINEDVSLMDLVGNTEEMDLFTAKTI